MKDKRAPRIVKHQHTRVIETGRNYSGEASPYWDWVRDHQPSDSDGNPKEPAQGNPDILPEGTYPTPQESGISVGDITRMLSGMQRKVFELYVQRGKSEREIANRLEISIGTVRTHLQRVREKYNHWV
jgi:RNA polymerase sigma factor (sigma-70 family)